MTFEEAKAIMDQKLGEWKIMALASCVNDYPMVRNVSCLFYNNKIYFKTDKNFRKTQQLFENPNVALCWSGVQVEGVAENKGLVVDEPGRTFETLYKKYLWGSYNKRSRRSSWKSGIPVWITTPISCLSISRSRKSCLNRMTSSNSFRRSFVAPTFGV